MYEPKLSDFETVYQGEEGRRKELGIVGSLPFRNTNELETGTRKKDGD